MMIFRTKESGVDIARRMVERLKQMHFAISLDDHRSPIYLIGPQDMETSTFGYAPAAIRRFCGLMVNGAFRSAGIEHAGNMTHRFKIFTSCQKRRIIPAIKREMRRGAAVEPVIGHIKDEHCMGRYHLAGT